MWHSPDCPPLDRDEQRRVRRIQERLCAVKQCADCLQWKPIQDFAPEAVTCPECAEMPVLERWWSRQKTALAS